MFGWHKVSCIAVKGSKGRAARDNNMMAAYTKSQILHWYIGITIALAVLYALPLAAKRRNQRLKPRINKQKERMK
jgi:hypothetical protein